MTLKSTKLVLGLLVTGVGLFGLIGVANADHLGGHSGDSYTIKFNDDNKHLYSTCDDSITPHKVKERMKVKWEIWKYDENDDDHKKDTHTAHKFKLAYKFPSTISEFREGSIFHPPSCEPKKELKHIGIKIIGVDEDSEKVCFDKGMGNHHPINATNPTSNGKTIFPQTNGWKNLKCYSSFDLFTAGSNQTLRINASYNNLNTGSVDDYTYYEYANIPK